jgi:hypothetical protein
MKLNMGTIDRIVRIVLAAVVAVLFLTGQIHGTLAIVLLAVGGILPVTSIIGFCPLYAPFKISMKGKTA